MNTDVDVGLQTSDSVQFASVQSDGGVTFDNITIDGTEIDLSSGDLTVDVQEILLIFDGVLRLDSRMVVPSLVESIEYHLTW